MDRDVVEMTTPLQETEARRRRIVRFAHWTAVEFLIAMVLFIFATPFVIDLAYGRQIEALLVTFMLISGVVAVSKRRSTLITAIVLVVPAVACRWLHSYRSELLPEGAHLVAAMVFLGFVLFQYFRYILRAPVVTPTVMCAAVSTYVLLGLLWTMAYLLLTSIRPDAFAVSAKPGQPGLTTGFDAFYFSFVTLSTIGYGDIVPVSKAARMLAVLEATTGTFFVALLIARLVAIHTSSGSSRSETQDGV
jgi:Ion channel